MVSKKDERLEQERINKQGYLMSVIKYNSASDIIVEFKDDYKTKVHTEWKHFDNGNVINPYGATVYGVGAKGLKYLVAKDRKLTKEYNAWHDMLKRCYDEKYHEKKPTYKECEVCNEWLLYENFYEWMHSQENFDNWSKLKLSAVDKDIIQKHNKIYSPDTCCLVPLSVNSIFTKTDSLRGDLPIGVVKYNNKYCAYVNNGVKQIHFNLRLTPEDAFYLDYKPTKEAYIKQVAKKEYENGNISKRCYEAMMKYEVEITD